MKRIILLLILALSVLLAYSQLPNDTDTVFYNNYLKANGEDELGDYTKSGNLAGDFHGNVKIDRDLYGSDSGSSDMKAYIYGTVNKRGNKVVSCSTDGFTVSKYADGMRKITFTGNDKPLNKNSYVVLATNCSTMLVIVTVWQENDFFVVVTRNIDENVATFGQFNFVVYKK